MRSLSTSLGVILLTFGLGMGTAVAIPAAGSGWQQGYYPAPYTDLRGLVDRTQSDLRMAADLERGGEKQRERYRSAQGHLSTFDRHLTKGHFDKDELDRSIDSIKDILDHNTLQASSRDGLIRDVEDLRAARDRRW
jgi:hypothetical protein